MSAVARARLELLTAALLFSSGGAAIKYCSLTNWQVAGFRSGLAALLFLVVLPRSRPPWTGRTLATGASYATMLVLFVTGSKLTTAANTIFLQSTAPLYVAVLGPWLLHEQTARRDLGFMLALAVGLALVVLDAPAPSAIAPRPQLGNLLAAATGPALAFTLVGLRAAGRGQSRHASPEAAIASGNILACLACLPWALPVVDAHAGDWLTVGFLGFFQVGLAYVLVTRAVRHLRALEASLLLLLEPALNPVWTWLVHGEVPGPLALAGGAIILAATALNAVTAAER